eukprot:TRINITY_DN2476_c0_g1_i1.p1 TRINITY_DN2476_c0_g1~~TRINITY_DN2476_c0_g1_i1.p1  ORF type:complete len:228 (+),score=30.42 TRINITY_DN2476_c0_g1_i1:178-861(+)
MCSKALPQALISIPRISTPHSSKLGFRVSSSLPSSFNPSCIAISRDSLIGFSPIAARRNKRSVVVNAEPNPAEEISPDPEEETSENVEEEKISDPLVSDAEVKRPPRKPRIKLGDIMGILNKRAVEAAEKERPVPDIRTGDIVEIKLEVPENKRRTSIYKGIVMSRQNAGIHTTIRIRRIIAGIGVEIVFPLYSPNIKEIKVVKHRKVRRARLYYLRDKLPRLSTFK